MTNNKQQIINEKIKNIPLDVGVYFMRDAQENILYIGKSKQLRSRVSSYFREQHNLSTRMQMMVQQIDAIEFIVTDTEAEALALEANLIKQHQPYFNVLLKDDKKYPYICITWSEDYPRIFITRKRKINNHKDRYYGPYVDTHLLRYTLDLLKRIFPLRQRPKPLFKDRPCLNYDLGRCPGVCQQLISPQEYHKIVQKVAMIFQGCSEELLNLLRSQMEKAALELKFEQAATLRDQIKGLGLLNCEQKVALSDDTISRDAIALAKDEQHCCIQLFQIRAGKLVGRLGFFADAQSGSSGEIIQKVLEEHYTLVEAIEIPREIITQFQLPDTDFLVNWLSYRKNNKINIIVPQRKSKAELIEMVAKNAQYELATLQKLAERNYQALQDLANILELKNIPKRIEGYDISHIQGSNAVAAQVVFIDGIAAKQHYRHYKIKNPQISIGHSDDFRSLQEVIERRFSQYISSSNKYDKIPDLIIIDGGKGQLSAVVKVLQKINILPYLKVISLAKQREEIFIPGAKQPLPTNPEQPGVQLLRRVRDEAHRFAVSFHRQQRLTKNRRSHLDEIPGLGFQRQQKLLAHFHSIDYIREASLEQLAQVNGIGINLAQQIYNYFHPTVNN